MNSFFLDIDADIKGLYLSGEMIDLLSIIQCDNIEELRSFTEKCPQFIGIDIDSFDWSTCNVEALKQKIFKEYQNTLVSLKESVQNKRSVILNVLRNCGLPEEEFDEIMSQLNNAGTKQDIYAQIGEILYNRHPQEYASIAEKQQKFVATERDQIKDVTYEEMQAINELLKDSNTILVAEARYCNARNTLYRDDVPGRYAKV